MRRPLHAQSPEHATWMSLAASRSGCRSRYDGGWYRWRLCSKMCEFQRIALICADDSLALALQDPHTSKTESLAIRIHKPHSCSRSSTARQHTSVAWRLSGQQKTQVSRLSRSSPKHSKSCLVRHAAWPRETFPESAYLAMWFLPHQTPPIIGQS